MGGAVVFPGGKVDPADHAEEFETLSTPLRERPRSFAADATTARAFAIAALREVLEEAAILPVLGDRLDGRAALALREELARQARTFADALRARNLVLDTARLEAVSRWITPEAEPRRFDTRFFLLALPPGQEGAHDERETTHGFWATPDELLERWENGDIVLAPPTSWTIALFRGLRDVEAAFEVARTQSLDPIAPCFVQDGEAVILTMPGDPLHPRPAAPPASADAPTRFVLEGGRFVPTRAR